MRILLNIIGGILAFSGTVWALQGMGILPGRLMGGQPRWILYGAIAVAIGVGILLYANRKRPS
jgi:hypothetical protein